MRDVTIDIRSAKNDEGGQGHRFTCTQVDLVTSTSLFDFSQESWDFACLAGPVRGTAFLTLQGRFRLDVRRVQQDVEAGSTGSGSGPSGHINTLAAHCRSVGAGEPGCPGSCHSKCGPMEFACIPGVHQPDWRRERTMIRSRSSVTSAH